MQAIDTSLAGNLKTLAQLSFAFGVPGAAFSVKYFHDFYITEIKLPAVTYMLPVGAIFLVFSLILTPAVYKSTIPSLDSWISRGITASQLAPNEPGVIKVLRWVSIIKLIRMVVLCSPPCFLILLTASMIQYMAA